MHHHLLIVGLIAFPWSLILLFTLALCKVAKRSDVAAELEIERRKQAALAAAAIGPVAHSGSAAQRRKACRAAR